MPSIPSKSRCALLVVAAGLSLFALQSARASSLRVDLIRCLVNHVTPADDDVIVKGVFALTTLSPKLKPYTVITDAQRAAINQDWGDLYTRLLTKDCRAEALLVLKVDGTSGVAVSLTPMQGAAVRTIEQEMNRYASSRGDNPAGYAREIAGRVGGGVTPDTRISSLTPAQREVVVQAIVTHEGATGTVRLINP